MPKTEFVVSVANSQISKQVQEPTCFPHSFFMVIPSLWLSVILLLVYVFLLDGFRQRRCVDTCRTHPRIAHKAPFSYTSVSLSSSPLQIHICRYAFEMIAT